MHIMATGVHNTFVLRFIWHIIGFQDRKSIHISAQCNDALARVFTLDQRDQARVGHPVLMLDAEGGELSSYIAAGVVFLEREFRVSVQMAALSDGSSVVFVGEAADFFLHGRQ